MCDFGVSAIAGMVISGASAVTSYAASSADYSAKSAQWSQNVVNAEAAARNEQRQIITQQIQEQSRTVQKEHISFLDQAQKSSSVEVSAASGGVSGLSVDNLLADIAGKSELNRTYADENYRYIVANTGEKLKATDDTLAGRINSVTRPTAPSPLSLAIGLADAGLKGYKGLDRSGGSMGDG